MSAKRSKKFGGQERAGKAREAMAEIFSDPDNPLYLEKDINLAKKFDVSRLTIYNIREQLGVLPRTERILDRLSKIKTKKYTKKELADIMHMKYQNLYKVLREYQIEVKEDIPPIQSMIKHQRAMRALEAKQAKNKKTSKESSSRGSKKTSKKS